MYHILKIMMIINLFREFTYAKKFSNDGKYIDKKSYEGELKFDGLFRTPGLSVNIASLSWDYETEDQWAIAFSTCGGTRQSPINIPLTALKYQFGLKCLRWSNYLLPQPHLTLKNSGHTVEASSTWQYGNKPSLSGGILSSSYIFEAVHWHWGSDKTKGSEHTINSISLPIEMHLVHYDSKYSSIANAVASGDSEALAVVGILFKLNVVPNPGMAFIVNAMLKANSSGIQNNKFLPLPLLGLNFLENYYTYLGSLTTPPCNQIVRWIVSAKKLSITPFQLNVFRNVLTNDHKMYNNFRHVQPINGREVGYVTKCKL